MKKILVCIPLFVGVVTLVFFSFFPLLEGYHLYSFDQRVEKSLGDGQKFTDADYKRCLLSEAIGGKCPATSDAYNPDTKIYDTGVSNVAQLYADVYGYDDPYYLP